MRDLLLGFDRLVDLNQHERINEIFGVFPVDRLINLSSKIK